jgi:antitoxin (DNA-binding transcriptional repressor) of toxin-antitoxin stability system
MLVILDLVRPDLSGGKNMTLVTIPEAQARLPELLSAVADGESVTIRAEDGKLFQLAVQTTTPFVNPNWPGYPKAGSCEGMFVVPDDFKEPLEEMREYME